MSIEKIHLGDEGSDIIVHFVNSVKSDFDVSTATSMFVIFQTATGRIKKKPATLVSSGADGRIVYKLVTGDIDSVGIWKIWGEVILASGMRTSDKEYFTVIN